MSIERLWNRNEVSRESPDKEVNRRPTSLRKFRADALRGPRVSIATGWNIDVQSEIVFDPPRDVTIDNQCLLVLSTQLCCGDIRQMALAYGKSNSTWVLLDAGG